MTDANISLNISIRLIQHLSNRLPWVSLHNISEETFNTQHHHVLNVVVDSVIIGLFLSLLYYNNVTRSRSESSILTSYLNIPSEYTFYCNNTSLFYELENNPSIIGELLDADYEDRVSVTCIKSDVGVES